MTEPTTCTVPVEFLRGVIALCTQRGYSPENIEAWSKDDKWVADLWRQAEQMLAIAKWGTPAPVGVEPAQWQKRHQLRTNGEWENTNEHDAKWWRDNSQGWEIRALYTPQPTQAQAGAVPLTPEQIKDEASHHGFIGSTEMLVKFVRGIEAHHGIKGGQHGAE